MPDSGAVDAATTLPFLDATPKGDTGSLLVSTGLKAFQVLLDNQPFHGVIRHGVMHISNLDLRQYHVRIAAEGYEAAEQDVVIRNSATLKMCRRPWK